MEYRDNVCAVIRNGNSVLICHRINSPKESGWQFPQGGIDKDRDLVNELKRELLEEIGTDEVRIIEILPKLYKYDFPEDLRVGKLEKYRGQQQKWALCEFIKKNQKLNLNLYHKPEFDDWAWVDPKEALERVVDFKKNTYKEALVDLGLI